MSHAEHAWVRDIVPRARKWNDLEHPLAILLDTQGPAIRTGALANEIELKPGDLLELTVRGREGEAAYSVDVNYDGLIDDVSLGDKILIDNGVIQLVVTRRVKNRIRCKAVTAGTLGSRRHINLPGVHVNLPPLTKKDLRDVDLGVEIEVDFVALSFARKTSDLEALRKVLAKKESKSTARIMAKIEEQSAVKQIDEMIEAADAIMVARGDLGIECPMEELPIIQRRIVKRSFRIGKPVIVATHMLESMIVNPVPTRAEITDVANAVFEQADGIMLSGETSMGRYPVECVKVLDRVARRIERSGGAGFAQNAILENLRQKTVPPPWCWPTPCRTRNSSSSHTTGRWRATFPTCARSMRRSLPLPRSESVYRQLALCWGTAPVRLDFTADPNANIAAAENYLRDATPLAGGRQSCHHQRHAKRGRDGGLRAVAQGLSRDKKTRGSFPPRASNSFCLTG